MVTTERQVDSDTVTLLEHGNDSSILWFYKGEVILFSFSLIDPSPIPSPLSLLPFPLELGPFKSI